MALLKTLRYELALAFLGEDWKKKHATLATQDAHPDMYHYRQAHKHGTAARWYKASADMVRTHPKLAKKLNIPPETETPLGGGTFRTEHPYSVKARRAAKLRDAHLAMVIRDNPPPDASNF